MEETNKIPSSLKFFFVIHFVVDVSVAFSLLFFPDGVVSILGLSTYEPFATNLLAAALIAIGLMSLLHRSAGIGTYIAMLNLKIIWSLVAIKLTAFTIFQTGNNSMWSVAAVFGFFLLVWIYYRVKLNG